MLLRSLDVGQTPSYDPPGLQRREAESPAALLQMQR